MTKPSPKSQTSNSVRTSSSARHGWEGWDQYAPFYDWENAQTLGRRDIPFWRRIALEAQGAVLELGCGTGRLSVPLLRAGVELIGIDRSAPMLAQIPGRIPNAKSRIPSRFVRGDIRALPFSAGAYASVIAPYGVLQSLLRDRDLADTLSSVARVLAPGGSFGIDLVPDVPKWREYKNQVQLKGASGRGTHLTLIESVRQDRARRRTTFEQRYVERRGRDGRVVEHRFDLTFRTLSMRQVTSRLERAGFVVDRVLGDYRGGAWDATADVWIILAKKR